MTEIVILAMVFAFVALRLWSVLGRRTGHEQPIAKPVEQPPRAAPAPLAEPGSPAQAELAIEKIIAPEAQAGLHAIADAERGFDPLRFVDGARGAYRMILEAFWLGDSEQLDRLVGGEVRTAFAQAIDERNESGLVLDNRLVSIENAVIEQARIEDDHAFVTIRFDADIAAVTRDAEGEVVAGSLSDAIQTHDIWTFSRRIGDDNPNWLLVDTDEAA